MTGWRLELDAHAVAPRVARRLLDTWLQALGCPEEERLDAVLAVSELVSIAITETVEPVAIGADRSGGHAVVVVRYRATLAEAATAPLHDIRWRLLEIIGVRVSASGDGAVEGAWSSRSC